MIKSLPVIFSVKVGDKHLDNEAIVVQAANPQALAGKPIPVQEHVRKSVERKLVEGRVQYWSFGEEAGAGPDDPVIKELSEGQNFPKPRI